MFKVALRSFSVLANKKMEKSNGNDLDLSCFLWRLQENNLA